MTGLDTALWVLSLCVMLAAYVLGVRRGVAMGRRERCGRHSHAEQVAAGRFEPARHNGPPARVTSADFRMTTIYEEPNDAGNLW